MVFDRLFSKRSLRRKRPGFRSRHGGLWTDRAEAERRLEQEVAEGKLTGPEAERVRFWIEHGYVTLEQAVPHDLIDRINADFDAAWRDLDPRLRIELDGTVFPLDPELRSERYKLLDLYVHYEAALEAGLDPAVTRFLSTIFEESPLLFQGLSFEHGSEQAVHQDSAYVVVESPMELAAAWIALEDIQPGSGELQYYPGSHRFEEHRFGGRYRNWNRERDGIEENERYLAGLHEKAAKMGLQLESFLPRKGDVFLWSADLAHGGAPVRDTSLTRRSFVCHYCPASVRPYYFSYRPENRTIRKHAGGLYSSKHYPLGSD